MEHYYVVGGNEFGVDLKTKKNFKPSEKELADELFDKIKYDDFGCLLIYVNELGVEKVIRSCSDGDEY